MRPIYLLGAHGGAGVSSLLYAGLGNAGVLDAERRWPFGQPHAGVVVVCRSSMSGLLAAQKQARIHAAGIPDDALHAYKTMPELLGLVVVADAPKLSRELAGERVVVEGAFPRHWHIPWLEEWRHSRGGELPRPPVVTDLADELRSLSGDR